MDWFMYSMGSVISFSLMAALYKLPAHKKQSKIAATFWMVFFSFLFSLAFFYGYLSNVDIKVYIFALSWGIGFSSLAAIQMYLLKKMDINVLFPISTTLSLIISVIFGLVFLAEYISLIQGLGIVLAIIAIYLFLFQGRKIKYSSSFLNWLLIMVVLSVFSKVILKFATDVVDVQPLMIFNYFFASIFLIIIVLLFKRKSWKKDLFSGASKSGFFIAVPGFLGNWFFLMALSKGPFTLITALHALYIFGASVAGYFFFKEALSKKKIALLVLAIIAIILIRIG